LVHGQVYGGVLQSLSIGLLEGYIYDEKGAMLNSNFTDYKIARASDMPDEHVVTLEPIPKASDFLTCAMRFGWTVASLLVEDVERRARKRVLR